MESLERIEGVAHPGPITDLIRDGAKRRTADVRSPDNGDRLELSEAGERLALRVNSPSQDDHFDRIRSEIGRGTYESPQKIRVVAERLMADLGAVDLKV